MKKILYLMNVDWNWIKQRPHFLAEQLTYYYDLTVVNQYRYTKKGYQSRKFDGKFVSFKVIPRIDRYTSLRWINVILKRKIIKNLMASENPDYIWITDPDQINWLPKNLGKIDLIYDCMDDHYGLSSGEKKKENILISERKLCERCKYLFVSSSYLTEILKKRYGDSLSSKITVIRNGYDGNLEELSELGENSADNSKFTAAYFGTIAEWFDFDLLKKSLYDFDNLEYRLIGPTAHGIVVPENSRIKHIGTVEHKDLYKNIEDVDCLIMPFKLTDSIKAVDPVKLYEYINFGKNIICIGYQEVSRFEPYAYFYNDYKGYKDVLKTLMTMKKLKYTNNMRIAFLADNTWKVRGKLIADTLGITGN